MIWEDEKETFLSDWLSTVTMGIYKVGIPEE
jgi:hypothetical protein